jgi:hypothetical protein
MSAHRGDLIVQLGQPRFHAAQARARLFGRRPRIHQMLLNRPHSGREDLRQDLLPAPIPKNAQREAAGNSKSLKREGRLLGVQAQLRAQPPPREATCDTASSRPAPAGFFSGPLPAPGKRSARPRPGPAPASRAEEANPKHQRQRQPEQQTPLQQSSLHCAASGRVPAGITARRICSLNSALIPRSAVGYGHALIDLALPAFTFSAVAARASARACSRSACHCFSRFSRAARSPPGPAQPVFVVRRLGLGVGDRGAGLFHRAVVRARRSASTRSRGRRTSNP